MQLKSIDLKQAVNRLEDGIIILSGPALAVSGILAGMDLVTGGHVMQSVPAISLTWAICLLISLTWAICLLISLDFQVLNLAARAHRVYLSKKSAGRKGLEVGLAVLIAASISYVSIQMQSIIAEVNSAGVSIPTAALQLGISPVWLIWERSALVLVLIFLSGWLREDEESSGTVRVPSVPPPAQVEQQSSISDETMQLILGKLAKLDELEKLFIGLSVSVAEVPVSSVPLLETGGTEVGLSGTDEPEPALDERIKALLAENNTLSVREIADIVKRPPTTVYRTLKRLEQSTKPVEQ